MGSLLDAGRGRAHADEPETRARLVVIAGLHLAVLTSFALAQPLLDVLGKNAEFFVARDASRTQIVLVALAILVIPPVTLFALELGVASIHARAVGPAHLLLVGLLASVVALGALRQFTDSSFILVVATVAGVVFAFLYRAVAPIRTTLTFLAPAPLVFLAAFLFFSPAAKLVLPDEESRAAGSVPGDTPVVVVVFDEFSSASLLGADGRIDSRRFPHFGELARDSVWFRNAVTVSPWTEQAVPAILTGRYPKTNQLPILRDHPENLFTLFGSSYEVEAFEPLTRLCPLRLCARRPSTTRGLGPLVADLVSDLSVIYAHSALPAALTKGLPPVTTKWGNFGDEDAVGSRPNAWAPDQRFGEFLGSIDARAGRLYFLHVLLPHVPWQYLPSGRRYSIRKVNAFDPGFARTAPVVRWTGDPWLTRQAKQRYLLQVGFVDSLVGRLIRRLRAQGLYDRALLVVTADHGVSFRAGDNLRAVTESNFSDIAFMPLLVKLPQNEGGGTVVADAARTIDIVPTIADAVGARIPWEVDGSSLLSRRQDAPSEIALEDARRSLGDLVEQRNSALTDQLAIFGSGSLSRVYRVGPHTELVGRVIERGRVVPGAPARANFEDETVPRFVSAADARAASVLTGTVSGVRRGVRLDLAIAVNGRIAAVTRAYDDAPALRAFAAIIAPNSYRVGRNVVEALVVRRGGSDYELAAIGEARSGLTFVLTRSDGGERITSSRGTTVPVRLGQVFFTFDDVQVESQRVRFQGWAADTRRRLPRERLLVFADGRFVASFSTAVHRPDLDPDLEQSGFDFEVPLPLLTRKNKRTIVRVFAVAGGVAAEANCADVNRIPPTARPRVPRRVVAVFAGATLVLPAACGGGGNLQPQNSVKAAEQLLTTQEVARYGRGTAARALLEWWRSSQYALQPAYLDAFTEEFRPVAANDPRLVPALTHFASAIRVAKPRIKTVDRTGDRAVVYTEIEYRRPVGLTRYIATTAPQAFEFRLQDGDWRLVDDSYVQSLLPRTLRR